MKGYLLSIWLFLIMISASLLRAADPAPGAWFFNANGMGASADPVFFSVGGTADSPPRKNNDVLLGWSWDQDDAQVACYPGRTPANYRPPAEREEKISHWRIRRAKNKLPALAIGPGWELFFLGKDSSSTQNAEDWAELLDTIEAAYRHSSPDMVNAERHGNYKIGIFGHCNVWSRPVKGGEVGWEPRSLNHRARASRAYHLSSPRPSVERGKAIQVQRFFRWIEDPDGDRDPRQCLGDDPFLHLFKVPDKFGSFKGAYFLLWKNLDPEFPDMFDLEPGPRPGVREAVSPTRKRRISPVEVAQWPPRAEGEPADLCRA